MKIVIDIPEDMWAKVKDGYVPLGIGKHLQNGTPLAEVIEDIKAEIADIYCGAYCDNPYTAGEVRERALEIIDEHISGKEQE